MAISHLNLQEGEKWMDRESVKKRQRAIIRDAITTIEAGMESTGRLGEMSGLCDHKVFS